jgi:hypothetical protein
MAFSEYVCFLKIYVRQPETGPAGRNLINLKGAVYVYMSVVHICKKGSGMEDALNFGKKVPRHKHIVCRISRIRLLRNYAQAYICLYICIKKLVSVCFLINFLM